MSRLSSPRWVHSECERRESGDSSVQLRDGYTCSACKQVETDSQARAAQEAAPDEAVEGKFLPLSTLTDPAVCFCSWNVTILEKMCS